MTRLLMWCMVALATVLLTAAPEAQAQAKKDAPAKTDAKAAAKTTPIDINSASVEELQSIPGIGEAYSKKIVDNRPYGRKDELVQKNVVPQATYDKIKDQIIAKQTTGSAKKKTAK